MEGCTMRLLCKGQWRKVVYIFLSLSLCLGISVLPPTTGHVWGYDKNNINQEESLLKKLEEAKKSGNLQRVIELEKELQELYKNARCPTIKIKPKSVANIKSPQRVVSSSPSSPSSVAEIKPQKVIKNGSSGGISHQPLGIKSASNSGVVSHESRGINHSRAGEFSNSSTHFVNPPSSSSQSQTISTKTTQNNNASNTKSSVSPNKKVPLDSSGKPMVRGISWAEIYKRGHGETTVKTTPKYARNPDLAGLADPANTIKGHKPAAPGLVTPPLLQKQIRNQLRKMCV